MGAGFPGVLIPSETAVYLRLSERQLRRLRTAGRGPRWMDIGGCVRYLEADLRAWQVELEAQTLRGDRQ